MALDPRFFASLVQPIPRVGTGTAHALQGMAGFRDARRMREQERATREAEEIQKARHAELAREFDATEARAARQWEEKRQWQVEDQLRAQEAAEKQRETALIAQLSATSDENEERAILTELAAMGRGQIVEGLPQAPEAAEAPEPAPLPGMPMIGGHGLGGMPMEVPEAPPMGGLSFGMMAPGALPPAPEPVEEEIPGQVSPETPAISEPPTRSYVTSDGRVIDLGAGAKAKREMAAGSIAQVIQSARPGWDRSQAFALADGLSRLYPGDERALFDQTYKLLKEFDSWDMAMLQIKAKEKRARILANAKRAQTVNNNEALISGTGYDRVDRMVKGKLADIATNTGVVSGSTIKKMEEMLKFFTDKSMAGDKFRTAFNQKVFDLVVEAQGSRPTDKDVEMLSGLQGQLNNFRNFISTETSSEMTERQREQLANTIQLRLKEARKLNATGYVRMREYYEGLSDPWKKHSAAETFRNWYGGNVADRVGIGRPMETETYYDDKRKRDIVKSRPQAQKNPEPKGGEVTQSKAEAEAKALLGI